MSDEAARPSLSTFEVTLTIGEETQRITGRAAQILASVALHAEAVNGMRVGKAIIAFAEVQARLELRHSFPPIRFDL